MKNKTSWDPIEVLTVDTVEDFWTVFSNIHKPTKLAEGAQIQLFRQGTMPKWEHESMSYGGVLSFECKGSMVDEKFKQLLLLAIGESIPYSEYVLGIAANRKRQGLKLEVWVRNATEVEVHRTIASYLVSALEFMGTMEFEEVEALKRTWGRGDNAVFKWKDGKFIK
jgi:translation initiation factor 4E